MGTVKGTRPLLDARRPPRLVTFRAARLKLPAQVRPVFINRAGYLSAQSSRERDTHSDALAIPFCAQKNDAILWVGHDLQDGQAHTPKAFFFVRAKLNIPFAIERRCATSTAGQAVRRGNHGLEVLVRRCHEISAARRCRTDWKSRLFLAILLAQGEPQVNKGPK